jgi:glycosyltransferase involved in cell wall biosynthesis
VPELPPAVQLQYTLLVATANAGQAAGRNAAARRAKGEILFFLDADDV